MNSSEAVLWNYWRSRNTEKKLMEGRKLGSGLFRFELRSFSRVSIVKPIFIIIFISILLLRSGGCPLISRKRFHVQRRSIYPQTRLEKAGDIGYFNFQSVPFFILKNVENGTQKKLHVPFLAFLSMENGTDRKLKQPMSPAFSRRVWGYIDFRCK